MTHFRKRFFGIVIWLLLSLAGCGLSGREETTALPEAETQAPAPRPEIITEQADSGAEKKEGDQETGLPYFVMEDASTFAYDTLTLMEQKWYREILWCLGEMEEMVRLDVTVLQEGVEPEDIDFIFQCVMMDHPELFYVEGYTYTKYTRGEELVAVEFAGTWNVDRETAEQRKESIERAVELILARAGGLPSDYDKIKFVYETIIKNTEYDLGAEDNQNIYSVFVGRRSVCQGYAKATQYLLNRMGVECVLVQGQVDTGEKHAWNLVRSDGSYYYVDTTWGDASYQMEEETAVQDIPDINYDYLCINSEMLSRTHTLETIIPMPYCVATADNYYVQEGALFTAYDEERLRELFAEEQEAGRRDVSLRCADESCYREMSDALIDQQRIFRLLQDTDVQIAYSLNDKQFTMTFWVTKE